MRKPLFVLTQYLFPHHLFSRFLASLMLCRFKPLKNGLIRWFIKRFGVNMNEALREKPEDYTDFNDFFTRALKPGLRPFEKNANALISPADGFISESGDVWQGQLFQAKGVNYSLKSLLANDNELEKQLSQGSYFTIYLSPRDYHCVHMPIDGRLKKTMYVPGRLFSVNLMTANHVPGLFARNERLVCEFDTEQGNMTLIFVGAMIVSGIVTQWSGKVTPRSPKQIEAKVYDDGPRFSCGDKIGHFNVGSTVIVLTEKRFEMLHHQGNIKLGQSIAQFS
ncbi:MAG: phosphatidylserine decarboxylase [Gammaproteobacteria bacterium CG11_big_fil_rev_8_21_14_0_20_46_22]|nr:MAG: phosphatidylserine decarboxylase [Gammaproteobacteria bacterium CG12_big_fil_rev_8_21_14_0_65_46_12]PIR10979.1 MAG: phosphatidylserine decarboxylase [Gammaproteobacteria bacterium CG11_big_fil_rev_8_21_14_0_20_46_22]